MKNYQIFKFPDLRNAATVRCEVCDGLIFQNAIVLCRHRGNVRYARFAHWKCSQNNLDPHFIQARDNHRVDIDLHNQAEKATVVTEVAAAVGVVIAPRQRPARRPTPPRETENMAPIPAFEQQEFATGYYHWFRQSVREAQGRDPYRQAQADSLFEFNIDAQHPPQMEVLMMDQNQRFAEEAFEEVQNRGPMNAEAWIFNEEQQSRLFVQRNMHQLTLLRKLPPIDLTDDRIRNAMGRQQQDPR